MRELTEADMLAIERDMADCKDGFFTMPSGEMKLPRGFNIPPNIRSISGARIVGVDLGPPVFVWRDDPLFNQGYIAAELALSALRNLKNGPPWDEAEMDADHAIERLETFLTAAREEAEQRARDSGSHSKSRDGNRLGP